MKIEKNKMLRRYAKNVREHLRIIDSMAEKRCYFKMDLSNIDFNRVSVI